MILNRRYWAHAMGIGLAWAFGFMCAVVPQALWAQQKGFVAGTVKDKLNKPVADAIILLDSVPVAQTDSLGSFRAEVTIGRHTLGTQHVGYFGEEVVVNVAVAATTIRYFVLVERTVELGPATIEGGRQTTDVQTSVFDDPIPIDLREIQYIPSPKMSIEDLIQRLPGVAASSEFSSQYRVRGGNFDENLIYIDDIEIYRPQLIRAGQQEGLGFTNPLLASNVTFSSGGFQAKYGDKMASVLNIQYRTPSEFSANGELGLLTQNAFVEGTIGANAETGQPGRLSYMFGFRRFSTAYLLNSLDEQGEYVPTFYDLQSVIRYKPKVRKSSYRIRERPDGTLDSLLVPSDPLTISLLTIITNNDYQFTPQSRQTTLGSIQTALRLFVAFSGQEVTRYQTGQGALTLEYRPRFGTIHKVFFSAYRSLEDELFTVEGAYRLSEINTNYGSDRFQDEVFLLGIGSQLRHARNYLTINVLNLNYRGERVLGRTYQHSLRADDIRHKLLWGLTGQQEIIEDQIYEWAATDSSEYFFFTDFIDAQAQLNNARVHGFLQYEWRLSSIAQVSIGNRFNYFNLNQEWLYSPRAQLAIHPRLSDTTRTLQLRFALGVYQQSPFYRELRDFFGELNPSIRAQRSLHSVGGLDYSFRLWGRPFKLYFEGYYKHLDRIVPYQIDNVRLRYYGDNRGTGYAYGADVRLSGQFLRDIDSWISFSYLKTMEDIQGDGQGFVRRPTDQRFQFSCYFQDELPRNPTFKFHLNMVFQTGIPFGPPGVIENRTVFQMPTYQRVDAGISKLLTLGNVGSGKFGVHTLWISLEVFNLFARQNTVSYIWVRDLYGTQFAVPNYLSQRLFNLRMIARFGK